MDTDGYWHEGEAVCYCPTQCKREAVMSPILSVKQLSKRYASGFHALKSVDLDIRQGEIFALLGPNGAGKTTLISIICGLVNPTSGQVLAGGYDIVQDYRQARRMIGLVPQELTTEAFETVFNTVAFSRALFGKASDPAYLEKLLRDLSLWEKRHNRIHTLSGGMKRRLLIAKALSHEPQILFLDEPTAGVDVSLRKETWQVMRALRDTGVTIILTTHYIDEAEEMADRIGVIKNGEILLVEDTRRLMKKLGTKQLILQLREPMHSVPESLASYNLKLEGDGSRLIYTYDAARDSETIASLLHALSQADVAFEDLQTKQSSLEDIFVSLLRSNP